jgi:hypothetical protein
MPRLRARHLTIPMILVLLLSNALGCYHYQVEVPERLPATQWKEERLAAKFWGAIQEELTTTNCVSNAIDQVRVSTNYGYLLVGVLTLGIYVPIDVEWRCSKQPATSGTL